jgi:hypothetical protein
MPCYERNPGTRPGLPEPVQNQLASSCETRTARPCLISLVAAAQVKVGRKDTNQTGRNATFMYGLRGYRRRSLARLSPIKKPHSIGAVRPQSEMRLEGEAVKPDEQLTLASLWRAVTAESTALYRARPVKTSSTAELAPVTIGILPMVQFPGNGSSVALLRFPRWARINVERSMVNPGGPQLRHSRHASLRGTPEHNIVQNVCPVC